MTRLTCIQKWKHINEYNNWQQFSDTACSRPIAERSAVDKVTSLWLSFFTRRHVMEVGWFTWSVIMLGAFGVDEMMHVINTAFNSFVVVSVALFISFARIMRRIIVWKLLLEALEATVCHATLIIVGCWLFIISVELPSVLWRFISLIGFEFTASLADDRWWCWCALCRRVDFSSSLVLERDGVWLNFTESYVDWYFWGHIVVVPWKWK